MVIRNYGDLLRYHNLIFGQSDTTAPQQATQRQPTETSGVIIAPKETTGTPAGTDVSRASTGEHQGRSATE